MLELVQGIEQQLVQLEAKLKSNVDMSRNISEAMTKMQADKVNAEDEAKIINGAIQAYRNVVVEMKKKLGTVIAEGELVDSPEPK